VQQGFIDRFGRDPSRLQLLFLSDADKLIPQSDAGATGQFPPKFSKTCSVVSSVKYIS